jgi:hypothetical protein
MGMPLGRYFAFIGSVLLALLFLADWYLPQPGCHAGPRGSRSKRHPPSLRP